MKKILLLACVAIVAIGLNSCKKSSSETTNVSTPPLVIGTPVSDAAPLSGTIKGTMLTGKTYTVSGDIIINAGDTLLIQPGVKVYMGAGVNFAVKGTLLSLGTKDNPNWITVKDLTKTDAPGTNTLTDAAFGGKWCGINCDTSCYLCVIKWTHVEYVGAAFTSAIVTNTGVGGTSYGILFQNPKGSFVFEDSWMYGTVNDAIRPNGKFCIMRNTFEKCGFVGGDLINVKSGGAGDAAFNMIIGVATNGTKASNKGGTAVQCDVRFYNNTYVNCGWRQANPTGRAGSWNVEEGAKGKFYNGLLVNCRTGLRVVFNPLADTTNITYGNNFHYGDSLSVYNWTYPPADLTKPQATDIPVPTSFLPTTYKIGDVYTANAAAVGTNNPMFVNYPLPTATLRLQDITAMGNFDFHLKPGSPAIGKGFTGFSPLALVAVDPNYGATEITPPGADCGAYQSSGKGNQH